MSTERILIEIGLLQTIHKDDFLRAHFNSLQREYWIVFSKRKLESFGKIFSCFVLSGI